ncbi:MAG: KpsF/GutQ family sugar-phosphate isomerase, partial [Alphaproteobacteria bacterium]
MTPSKKHDTDSQSGDLLQSARRVLGHEIDGMQALSASLDGLFIDTLDLLSSMQGRCVVTGMGKSGHIANKIAATMASTGTPAMFVHPAEASHGDLGMITAGDVVIALSNSGETTELADLLAYTRRFAIPLIAITSGAGSTLAEAADVALVLPSMTEACPMGLAPTTSTTVMLALGDAIAVAMLERKGFSPDDFQVFHPGGKLGQQLLKVADIMHSGDDIPLLDATTPMSDAIPEMTAKSFGCLGIVDKDGHLEGIITDGDLRRHMGSDLIDKLAGDIMTRGSSTIGPGALASEALGRMNAKAITTLFVTEDGRP